jgi:hypothetical protein
MMLRDLVFFALTLSAVTACGPAAGPEVVDANALQSLGPEARLEVDATLGVVLSWRAGSLDLGRIDLAFADGTMSAADYFTEELASGVLDLSRPPRELVILQVGSEPQDGVGVARHAQRFRGGLCEHEPICWWRATNQLVCIPDARCFI